MSIAGSERRAATLVLRALQLDGQAVQLLRLAGERPRVPRCELELDVSPRHRGPQFRRCFSAHERGRCRHLGSLVDHDRADDAPERGDPARRFASRTTSASQTSEPQKLRSSLGM